MRLGIHGSRYSIEKKFKRKFNTSPPEWMTERALHATHNWTQVESIVDGFGFYDVPDDALAKSVPDPHRSEVFENELDYMTPVAAELVTELIGGDVVVTEMPYAGNFRTDLAISEIDRRGLRKRLTLTDGDDRSLVDEWKFMKTYRFLRNAEPMTYDEFAENGPYTTPATNKKVWNRLEDMGLLITRGGYGTIINVPIHITAHAVELKQKDWETAYEQARRAALPRQHTDYYAPDRRPQKYGYAHYAWVVMDAGHVHRALEHRGRFENGGVGLISLDKGGAIMHVEARGFSPPKRSMDLEHLNEKTIQKIDVDDYVNRSGLSRQSDFGEVLV